MFVSASGKGRKVVYVDDDGTKVIYSGGNRPWRNQNPGNLGAGAWANRHGAIGAAGGFAVFPNYEIGRKAIFERLQSPDFINETIWDAIPHYAPASENDVKWYRKVVKQDSGLDLKRKIKDLSNAELEKLVHAIERAEGKFKVGKITKIPPKKKITGVSRDDKGSITGYYVEGMGLVPKARAIQLAQKGLIDAVVVHSARGGTYLRTRPDGTVTNNIDHMP